MAQLIFKRGSLANLNNLAIKDGQFIVTTDEGALYVDNGSTRVRLGDFIVVENVAALPSAGANRKAMYYCESENVLARWNGTDWVQINKQPTTAELKVKLGLDAEGEVTAAIAAAKKAGDDAQVDVNALTDYVGTFTHDTAKTVIEYVNAKTDGIATSGNLEALGQRVTTVEGKVATIEGDYLKGADKTELEGKITAAQNAADKAQGDVDTLAGTHATDKAALEGAIALKANIADVYNKGEIDGKVDTINEAIGAKANAADVYTKDDVDGMVEDLEAADLAINNLIGEVTAGKTVVDMIAEAQSAASYDDEEVRGLIDTNAQAIAQEKTDREGAVSGLKTELEGKINAKVDQDAYNTKVGELVAEDVRLAGLINGNAAAIGELGTEIDNLVGEDTGKTIRAIANEELAAQLIAENAAEALDSLQEIAAWIQEHPGDAATMNAAIGALQAKVDTGDQTVSAYVTAAINALSIGDYATVEALNAAIGRIANLETASATHATKDELKVVSDALNEYKEAHKNDYDNDAVDAKVKGVQDQIDVLNDTYATDAELTAAMEAEVTRADAAYAAKAATETHIDDTDIHVTTEDKDKWNGAQAAAEATAATNLATARTEITAEIATAKGEAISDAEGKIATAKAEAIADAEGKIATAKGEAIADAEGKVNAAKTEMQGKIDTVSGALDTYKTENNAAVATKANAADVFTKTEVEAMLTWGDF